MNQETLLPQIDQDVEQGFDPHLLQMVELERIARAIDVEDAILEQMRHAELELTIHLPASRSDGATLTSARCNACTRILPVASRNSPLDRTYFSTRYALRLWPTT